MEILQDRLLTLYGTEGFASMLLEIEAEHGACTFDTSNCAAGISFTCLAYLQEVVYKSPVIIIELGVA
jgi:hypothetical protein